VQLPLSLNHLADTVSRFVASKQPSSIELVQDLIRPLEELGELCIIGGLVRDLAFYGLEDRPLSDVDLVVRAKPAALARFAERVGAAENRFGGFGLKTSGFKADFWAFSSTWAKRTGHVSLRRTSDLAKCTFFDWDAAVYSLRTKSVYAINGYLDRLRSRVLDVNLLATPSEKGNLVRSLRRIVLWDARPGPKLKRFLKKAIPRYAWSEIVAAEEAAFYFTILSDFKSAADYEDLVLQSGIFPNLGRHDRRQRRFTLVEGALRQHVPGPDIRRLSKGAYLEPVRFDVPEMPTEIEDIFEHYHRLAKS
jgi:hypothetical protein